MLRRFFFVLITLQISVAREYTDESAKVKTVFDSSYYTVVSNLIDNAQREILICMFQFSYYSDKPESFSNMLVSKLIEKSRKGVKIKILLEGGESFLGKGFYESVKEIKGILKQPNIEIKTDKNQKTTHAKFVIVDSKYVLLGSTNWTYYGLQENNESNVLIESEKVAKEFKKYFEKLWEESEVSAPSYIETKKSIFYGVVKSVEKKVSKKGKPYTIIYLKDGMKVFITGHYDLMPGVKIKIEGKLTTFRGKEEIRAYRIEIMK
ncbi:MAG: phospholipase D-like domain-containing protein [bacterium]|nr:phospholipase D-like domain-containing protein [bacterium]